MWACPIVWGAPGRGRFGGSQELLFAGCATIREVLTSLGWALSIRGSVGMKDRGTEPCRVPGGAGRSRGDEGTHSLPFPPSDGRCPAWGLARVVWGCRNKGPGAGAPTTHTRCRPVQGLQVQDEVLQGWLFLRRRGRACPGALSLGVDLCLHLVSLLGVSESRSPLCI